MKPILLIEPNQISADGIAALTENGICCVVTKDPNKVKFLDPIPAQLGRDKLESAAIQLTRWLLEKDGSSSILRTELLEMWTAFIVSDTVLSPELSEREIADEIIEQSRVEELVELGKVQAREEFEALKAERLKQDEIERAKKLADKVTTDTPAATESGVAAAAKPTLAKGKHRVAGNDQGS